MVALGYPGRQTLGPGITRETHSRWDGHTGRDTEGESGQCACGPTRVPPASVFWTSFFKLQGSQCSSLKNGPITLASLYDFSGIEWDIQRKPLCNLQRKFPWLESQRHGAASDRGPVTRCLPVRMRLRVSILHLKNFSVNNPSL